jgi:geranylgeranyl diphosphate synthase type I
LVLLAAEAVGCAVAPVNAAVVVELVHNFSLLHDDVMDQDVTRRHRPTAWTVFGVSQAILTGDALLTAAFDVLADSENGPAGARMLSRALMRLVDGQGADVAFERRADVGLAECVTMAGNKTAALLGCACALGALTGGGSDEQIDELRQFGEHLGLAFQLVDDLLGIWGDPAVTGKPVYSDLAGRKKSLPVVAALGSGSPVARDLAALYHADVLPSDVDLVRVAELVRAAGGQEWAKARSDDEIALALRHLRAARPSPRAAAELRTLATLIIRRDC